VAPVDPPALYVAHDDRMVVVSVLPLKVQVGRGEVYRWGSVLEISPAEPDQAVTTARQARGVAVLLFMGSAVLGCTGVAWWPALAVVGASVLAASFHVALRTAGVIVAPEIKRRPGEHVVLFDDEDRKTFSEAVDIGERIARTWPALHGLVDTTAAERLLAHALWELAGVLERRQDFREMGADLAQQDHGGLPADSPGVRDLLVQREKVAKALAGLDAEVNRHLADLTATAIAGENFIREQEIGQLVRDADQKLAKLAPHDLPGEPKSGAELADQTQAVLTAYRDLTTRYGDGV
jgi:hypothetical protein